MLTHVKHHSRKLAKHVKEHHKKYLFGLIRWWLFTKVAIFIATWMWVSLSISANADLETWCYLTGQELTGSYFTWEYLTGGELTGGYLTGSYITGCYMTGQELTGGYLSGDDLRYDQYLTGWYEEGCYETGAYLTWQELIWAYLTGWYYTWEYLTGGYITWCVAAITLTWDTEELTGDNQQLTWDTQELTWEVDAIIPTLSWITVSLNWVTGSYIGIGWTFRVGFTASEELTWIVSKARWRNSSLFSKSGLQYIYSQTLSDSNVEWALTFSIAYSDLAGNTGVYSASWPILFDKTAPIITWFNVSWDNISGFYLSWKTSEKSKYIMNYTLSWADIQSWLQSYTITWDQLLTWFTQLITGVDIGNMLNFEIIISDILWNSRLLTWDLHITDNWEVIYNYSIDWESNIIDPIVASTWTQITGTLATFAKSLQNEVNKFHECRDSIEFNKVILKIKTNDFELNVPEFQKDYVKKIVEAFTMFIVTKIRADKTITSDDLNVITNKFNNFLVILKLLRDDDNSCKQNLSNYHIMQFQNTLQEFNISL